MVEVQANGFGFEKWVRDSFFSAYTGNYMQEWDVPAQFNAGNLVPAEFWHLPVSIKSAKVGSPIGLGDVLRQYRIDESFLMITGFWEQRTKTEKWFIDIGVAKFTPQIWHGLWGQLALADLTALDAMVKNRGEHYTVVRTKAKVWKKTFVATKGDIVINPKIDSKDQRRVQCSLPYNKFWELAGRAPVRCDRPEFWGHVFPNPVKLPARTFNQS